MLRPTHSVPRLRATTIQPDRSMNHEPPSLRSLVFVPAILTLLVTVLRLVGELEGWSPLLFGTPNAGGDGAILGISWLIFVFGLGFGVRVQRSRAGLARPGKTLLLSLVPIGLMFGGIALFQALGLVLMPTPEAPGEPQGLPWFFLIAGVAAPVSLVVWPRVGVALLVYAFLARLPVVAVTWLALERGWDTHHVKLPPEFTAPPADELFGVLSIAQVTIWPVLTVVLGTAMAGLGALLAGTRRD